MKYYFIGFLLLLLQLLSALDPFAVMDFEGTGLNYARHKNAFTLPENANAAFLAQTVDLNYNWKKNLDWNKYKEKQDFKLFSSQQEYLSSSFSLLACKNLNDLNIQVSELTGPGKIDSKNIQILQILPGTANKGFRNSMLLKPELKNVQATEQLNFLLMIYIPKNTAAGIYLGEITFSAEEQTVKMPISLRVMDFILPEAGDFGFYIYGNLYDEKSKFPIPQKGFVKENLSKYFDFYKTRRLNSVTIYDNTPDLRYVDGKVSGYFNSFSAIAAAMKKSELTGKLIIDLRDIGYWANAVAQKIEELNGQLPPGDLGITMAQRKNSTSLYSEKAKEIYAEVIRLLLDYAKKEDWPEIRLLADEEMGNQTAVKIANYESFMPVIMEICPELAAAVDNGIGYGRKEATEYGARDKVIHRQYNSWTEEALKKAKEDNAEVWSFNYGPQRLSFGFTQQRLNSKGNHQWADLWDAANFKWQFTRLSAAGVVSSLEVERIHEGCVDYAACEYLKKLIKQQEKKGNDELVAIGKKALQESYADLSVLGDSARNLAIMLSDENLNARRWHIFLAIEKLLEKEKRAAFVDGEPKTHIEEAKQITIRESNYLVTLKQSQQGKILASAENTETFWSETIGPLTYLTEHEARLRARSSTVEEFQKLNQPSHTVVKLACLADGLAVWSLCNHVKPEGSFRYERSDDDGDMWQDDCMELFFALPNGKTCRLLYNSAGAKTFMYDGAIIPAAEIKSFIKFPANNSGGTYNKLLVPWHYFGLKQMPLAGTVWEFNVGREFHTYQKILSWARVAQGFHERDKWGRILFTDDNSEKIKIAPSITLDTNTQAFVISGESVKYNLEARSSDKKMLSLQMILRHSDGETKQFLDLNLPLGNTEIHLTTTGLKPGKWSLQFCLTGSQPVTANSTEFKVLPKICK